MSAMEQLWIYQQADSKVVKYENEMRQDPNRRKLVKLRNYYKEQQNAMQSVEDGVSKTEKTIAQCQSQYEQLKKRLDSCSTRTSEDDFSSASEVKSAISDINDIVLKLQQLQQRLQAAVREADGLNRSLRQARSNAQQAKNDYTELKKEYDEQLAVQTEELKKLEAERDALSSGIPPQLIAKYNSVKQRCFPPIAKLVGEKCGGCNMELPAVTLSDASRDGAIVECENCGRILYVK